MIPFSEIRLALVPVLIDQFFLEPILVYFSQTNNHTHRYYFELFGLSVDILWLTIFFLLGYHLTWHHIWEFWRSFLRVLCFFLNLSAICNVADTNLLILTELSCTFSLCLCESHFYVFTKASEFPPVYSYCSFLWPIYHLNLFQRVFVGKHQRRCDMMYWQSFHSR